jgi:catechol 2,3-dioxygenase-like lactoylglutathione lyase family enzyme
VTVALREILVGVADLDSAIRFYRDGFGLAVRERKRMAAEEGSAAWIHAGKLEAVSLGRADVAGSSTLRLLESTGPPGRSPGETTSAGPLGTGFTTTDIRDVHQRLESLGMRFLSPPLELTPELTDEAGPRRFEVFGQTGDGEFAVLIERRRAPGPYGTIDPASLLSEPLHTSHVVEDLERCRRFMEEVLDHRVLFAEECRGREFEDLMALPPGTSLRFQMLAHPQRETGRIIFIEIADERSQESGRVDPRRPRRGICALTYSCDKLEDRVATAGELGATVLLPPTDEVHPFLGRGRWALLTPPFDLLLELWEPAPG